MTIMFVLMGMLLGAEAPLDGPAPSPSIAVDGLADMPGTSVSYYDVTGRDVTAINKSIASQRPKGRNGKPIPASTDWAVKADFDRRVEDGQCRVTAARADFSATAQLPRLADEKALDRPLLDRWRWYVGQLEQSSLATLVFVYQNIEQVEKAILASSCEDAKDAGAAAVQRLREHAAVLEADREKRLARANQSLSEFRPSPGKLAKTQCKDLLATGSRLRSFRICMPAREWDRLHASGQEVTRDIQNQSIKGRYF